MVDDNCCQWDVYKIIIIKFYILTSVKDGENFDQQIYENW